MFEEFVSLYKDIEGFVHIYYFPGIGEDNKPIAMPLDLSSVNHEYKYKKLSDGAIDYTFVEKGIHTLTAKLVNRKTGEATIQTIKI